MRCPTQLPDRLLVVPERGGLITGWRCNGVEWLYLDVQRFADPSKSVRGGDRRLELAPGASSTLQCRYRMSGGPSTQASG